MKKIVAVFMLVIAPSVFAAEQLHNWFDTELTKIGSSRMWPSDGSDYNGYNCTITNTAAGVYRDGSIVFNADDPMTVCPYVSNTVYETCSPNPAVIKDEHYVEVVASLKMVPFKMSSLPEVPDGAKTCVIAVDSGEVTNFWVAAGTETLYWTNTEIAADCSRALDITVTVRTNDFNSTYTEWSLDHSTFACTVAKVSQLNGVAFRGQGELSNCYGDKDKGLVYVAFRFEPIPENVFVAVTNSIGTVLEPNDIGDYEDLEGRMVYATYSLPQGWKFYTGAATTNESFAASEGPHVPLGEGEGINEIDFGPENGWMVLASDPDGLPELVGRYANLSDALNDLKDGYGLLECYSSTGHAIEYGADGKSIIVDGVEQASKARYHYEDCDGVPMLVIDEAEKVITSFGEDSTDPTQMSVGSIPNSYVGFDYSVIYGDDVTLETNPGETESVQGTGGPLTLKAPKGDGDRRFYKIRITDQQIIE